MQPKLVFKMDLPEKAVSSLIMGRLILSYETHNIAFQATSGIARWQYQGSWIYRGKACLPPSKVINANYTVSTERIWLGQVKGIEGSFYKINPHLVNFNGRTRGDFGVHFDPPGTEGSAGCITFSGKQDIKQKHWDIFRHHMSILNSKEVKQIPLEVIYS